MKIHITELSGLLPHAIIYKYYSIKLTVIESVESLHGTLDQDQTSLEV